MKRHWLVLIALLLTFTLACSVFSPKPKDEAATLTTPVIEEETQPAKQETDETVASPTPTSDDSSIDTDEITIDENALEGLNSYRLTMTWSFTSEDNATEEFTIEQEAIREPAAQRYVMAGNTDQDIEFIQIEDTQWMRFGDEWMQTTNNGDDATDEFGDFFIDPESMFSDLGKGDYEDLGKETINGVKTRHLRVDQKHWTLLPGTFNAGGIESGVADIWVADERDLPEMVIRFEMEMEGTIEEDKKGTLLVTWEVYDINEPFTIEPPAEGENAGLPPEVPFCPNSSELTAMGSLVMFRCEGSVKDVNEFYNEELSASGWEKTEGTEMDAMATSAWTKDDQTLQLTITPHDSGTGSNVMIVTGE